jgi:hypothetical protein
MRPGLFHPEQGIQRLFCSLHTGIRRLAYVKTSFYIVGGRDKHALVSTSLSIFEWTDNNHSPG